MIIARPIVHSFVFMFISSTVAGLCATAIGNSFESWNSDRNQFVKLAKHETDSTEMSQAVVRVHIAWCRIVSDSIKFQPSMKLSTVYTRRLKRKSINGEDMICTYIFLIILHFRFRIAYRQSTANLQFRFSCSLFCNGKSDTIAMHVSNCALSQNSTASPSPRRYMRSGFGASICCVYVLATEIQIYSKHSPKTQTLHSTKESTRLSKTDDV